MSGGTDEKFDFFLIRRGSVAAVAREVEQVLSEKGYKVFVQDYDIPLGANFINAMHEAIKSSRDLIVLFSPPIMNGRHLPARSYSRRIDIAEIKIAKSWSFVARMCRFAAF